MRRRQLNSVLAVAVAAATIGCPSTAFGAPASSAAAPAPAPAPAPGSGAQPASGESTPSAPVSVPNQPAPVPTPTPTSPAPPIAPPSLLAGASIARIVQPVPALSAPGVGRRIWLAGTATAWSHEPQVLMVLGSTVFSGRLWLHLLLPIRPNGSDGWIPRNDVVLSHTPYWISVHLRTRTVSVYRNGVRLQRFLAVVGKPSTPTPQGLGAVYEKNLQAEPTGFLGPWALPLTLESNALRSFEGGPGRVAIHGRDGESLLDPLGSALSHGCMRISNEAIEWLAAHVPQGTPVQIAE
jgi:lipoprotein-anchoring transpeptidase ErfK/SrfK